MGALLDSQSARDLPATRSASSRWTFHHWVLALAILAAVVVRLPELVKLPLVDQANFSLGARELWAGKVLYRDVFDVKPPLIYWVYAALGAGSAPSYARVVAADLGLVIALFCIAWGALARLEPGARRDALGMLGIGAAFAWFSTDLGVLQAETVCNVLIALAWFSGRDGRPSGWLVGLCALGAGLAKILPAAAVLAVALAATERGARLRVAAQASAVMAVGVGAWLASLKASGALDAFREAMAYASFQRGITVMAAHNALVVWPVWALPGALAAAALALDRSRARAPLGAWLAVAALQIALQQKYYAYHFIALMPPLSLLAGLGLHRLCEQAGEWAGLRITVVCVLAQAGLAVNSHLDYNSLAIARCTGNLAIAKYEDATEPTWEISTATLRALASELERHGKPDEAMFTFGIMPQLYLLSGRPLWGPYVFHYGLLAETSASRGFGDLEARQKRFLELFDRAPPRVVVVPDSQSPVPGAMEPARELGTFRALAERLERDYEWTRVASVRMGFRRP